MQIPVYTICREDRTRFFARISSRCFDRRKSYARPQIRGGIASSPRRHCPDGKISVLCFSVSTAEHFFIILIGICCYSSDGYERLPPKQQAPGSSPGSNATKSRFLKRNRLFYWRHVVLLFYKSNITGFSDNRRRRIVYRIFALFRAEVPRKRNRVFHENESTPCFPP